MKISTWPLFDATKVSQENETAETIYDLAPEVERISSCASSFPESPYGIASVIPISYYS